VIEPYFKGFKGTIRNIGTAASETSTPAISPPAISPPAKYIIKGVYEIIADRKVRITELPIGTWTDDYKQFLEKLMDATQSTAGGSATPPVLKEYVDMSTDTIIDITVTFHTAYPHTPKELEMAIIDAEAGTNKLEKLLGLFTTQSTTNMNLFDPREKLRKYATIYNIIDDYFAERLELYSKRKIAMLSHLGNELRILTNRAKYIQEVLDDKLELRRQTKEAVFEKMTAHGYEHINGDEEFKYLLKMPMDSVTDENVKNLLMERDNKRRQYQELTDTTIQNLWRKDLDELEQEYRKWVSDGSGSESGGNAAGGSASSGATKKKIVMKKKVAEQ
jgi:DNA topoisomerase-2